MLLAFPCAAQPVADPAAAIQVPSSDDKPPAGVAFRVVSIISDGVWLHGEVFYPVTEQGRKLPTIISAHGWGGVAAFLRQDGACRLPGDRLRLPRLGRERQPRGADRPEPASKQDNTFTAQVRAQRGYVDPFEQVEDWFNVIDWAQGEMMVDTSRIGVRGTSYSGGHAASAPRAA